MTSHLDLGALVLAGGAHETRDQGVCLMWPGRTDEDGYGRIGKRSIRAHRVAWERANRRQIPPGLVVMHTCDNPPCVNPSHLILGTVGDNNRDREAKGHTRGLIVGAGAALQRAKTHCPQGHPYSGSNVRFRPDGRRRCAACYRERARRQRAARKESRS